MPTRGGLLERVCREVWNLGIVRQTAADIARNGITRRIEWLPQRSRWSGLADPACYTTVDGHTIVLAEHINGLGLGKIWAADIAPGSDPIKARFQPWATAKTHLSYPFPITVDGTLYMTMETAEAKRLSLWRQEDGTWIERVLLNRPVIDPTFWHNEEGWWLFCTFADDGPDNKLQLFYADQVEGPWTPHPQNPVKLDTASARPAGPLFLSDGALIRPSQDCTMTYGGAIALNRIACLTRQVFREDPVRRLEPCNAYPHGLHTICPAGDITIVDGKRWSFHPLDPIRYMIAGTLNVARRRRSVAGVTFL